MLAYLVDGINRLNATIVFGLLIITFHDNLTNPGKAAPPFFLIDYCCMDPKAVLELLTHFLPAGGLKHGDFHIYIYVDSHPLEFRNVISSCSVCKMSNIRKRSYISILC